ncbi:hypothetical protein GCM10008914_22460 [Clostridium tertium]
MPIYYNNGDYSKIMLIQDFTVYYPKKYILMVIYFIFLTISKPYLFNKFIST